MRRPRWCWSKSSGKGWSSRANRTKAPSVTPLVPGGPTGLSHVKLQPFVELVSKLDRLIFRHTHHTAPAGM